MFDFSQALVSTNPGFTSLQISYLQNQSIIIPLKGCSQHKCNIFRFFAGVGGLLLHLDHHKWMFSPKSPSSKCWKNHK